MLARLVESLARAIHAAHLQGVIHRDLKPANILFQPPAGEGAGAAVPKIADFGTARPVQGDGGLTKAGFVVGTPAYMAPEQTRGKSTLVGPAADGYALGVMLYELLTGRPPFQGDDPVALLGAVSSTGPRQPRRLQPHLPRDPEAICLKCLEKEPHRRYASAWDLAEDLRRFLDGGPVQARPAGPREQLVKWVRRRPAQAALVAALVAVVVLGFAGVTWEWRQAVAAQDAAEQERDTARRQTYRANLAAAARGLRLDHVGAARGLAGVP